MVFLLSLNLVYAQRSDYNKIILPNNTEDIAFVEKLVQLAWQNYPSNRIAKQQVQLSELDLKKTKRQWFDIGTISGNVNEFNFSDDEDLQERSEFFPRYNIRASISLSMLFNTPLDVGQSRINLDLAKEEVNQRKLAVRREVIQLFNNYTMLKEIHSIQTTILEDATSAHQLKEQNFQQGEESYDNYLISLKAFNNEKIKTLQSETAYRNAQLDLEEVIGISLNDVNF